MAKDTRLQKMLADCGVASRRKAEEMIEAGRVAVNGFSLRNRRSSAPTSEREKGLSRLPTYNKEMPSFSKRGERSLSKGSTTLERTPSEERAGKR